MARKALKVDARNDLLESPERMEMFLRLMQTGECIGRIKFGGKRYQLWDYETSKQSKLPDDILVGIWMRNGQSSYFYIRRVYADTIVIRPPYRP